MFLSYLEFAPPQVRAVIPFFPVLFLLSRRPSGRDTHPRPNRYKRVLISYVLAHVVDRTWFLFINICTYFFITVTDHRTIRIVHRAS